MGKPRRRIAGYLLRRRSGCYFRFRLPTEIQSILGREEIRFSLLTTNTDRARERIGVALPDVFAIRRLSKQMKELTTEEARRAATFAVGRLVNTLHQSRAAWERHGESSSPGMCEDLLSREAFGFAPKMDPDHLYPARTDLIIHAIQRGEHGDGVPLARHILKTLKISGNEHSEQFRQLAMEMLKLQVTLRQVVVARVQNDFLAEQRLLSCYAEGSNGAEVRLPGTLAAPLGPSISDAWKEYSAEKTGAFPRPTWKAKTAAGQQAMFLEFKEIVGDISVGQVTREVMLQFRDGVARLPANRHKRYPGKTIAELLNTEIPAGEFPTARTVHEKLVQIGAFFKWCRETKRYLSSDPLAGVHVEANSQSYSPFTREDLVKLFNSDEYDQGSHSKSWHFWVPLVALYTGARQSEIAQLSTSNVVKEDSVWVFAITDQGEGQQVKTKAGVRKVPVSSRLISLGFLDYVEFIRQKGERRLFPDIPKGKHGWGGKVSRWFNHTYRKNCGIESDPTGRRKVFHSFRHTAITKALSKSPALLAHCQQVFGHEKSLLGETATYMGQFPVETLVPVIEALDYGLDHSKYAQSWRTYAGGVNN